MERIERYDKHGNKIEEALYNEKGNLETGIDGWAAKRWRYEGNVMMAETSYGEDGTAIERKQYNESGDLIAKQYVDNGDIDPYEESNTDLLFGHRTDTYYKPDGSVEYGTEIVN